MQVLNRNPEMDEERTPIVSIVIVADKNRCPPNFVPIVKAYDDGSDADLWKDGFGFGIFNRTVRYLAISRHIAETHGPLEVLIDLAVISEREAIPSNFICLDYTIDSKEKALKKKYLCARFAPRSDCVDAVSNILILAKQKRPPKGYSQAGEIDGMVICHKISTIPENYGNSRLTHSQSTELDRLGNAPLHGPVSGIGPNSHLYPNVNRHSTSDLDRMGQFSKPEKSPIPGGAGKIIDRIPFQLSPLFSIACTGKDLISSLPPIPDIRALNAKYVYNFRLEMSIASPPLTPTSPPPF